MQSRPGETRDSRERGAKAGAVGAGDGNWQGHTLETRQVEWRT